MPLLFAENLQFFFNIKRMLKVVHTKNQYYNNLFFLKKGLSAIVICRRKIKL